VTEPLSGIKKSDKQPAHLVLARVLRPHGVRGGLRIAVTTPFPDRLRDLEKVLIGRDPEDADSFETYSLRSARLDKNNEWLIQLEGVETRDDAERFRHHYLLTALEDAVPLEDDEVYLFQVMGLEVRTEDGRILGRVTDFIETGANMVYVVQGETYGEVLIPDVQGFILDINPEAGFMLVRLMPGLLPGDS